MPLINRLRYKIEKVTKVAKATRATRAIKEKATNKRLNNVEWVNKHINSLEITKDEVKTIRKYKVKPI